MSLQAQQKQQIITHALVNFKSNKRPRHYILWRNTRSFRSHATFTHPPTIIITTTTAYTYIIWINAYKNVRRQLTTNNKLHNAAIHTKDERRAGQRRFPSMTFRWKFNKATKHVSRQEFSKYIYIYLHIYICICVCVRRVFDCDLFVCYLVSAASMSWLPQAHCWERRASVAGPRVYGWIGRCCVELWRHRRLWAKPWANHPLIESNGNCNANNKAKWKRTIEGFDRIIAWLLAKTTLCA